MTGSVQCYNSILWANHAVFHYPNYEPDQQAKFAFCCTTPLPPGDGNINTDPRLEADGVHITATSPCTGLADPNLISGLDIDGGFWKNPPAIGADEPPLTVQEPTILVQPVSQIVEEGVNLSLGVIATNYSVLALAYQWRYNGSNISGATESVLSLRSVREADNGIYSVLVSTGTNAVVSEIATLMVKPVVAAAGPGVVTNATQANLEAALNSGSTVTFGFNGTIPITNTLVIATDTTIDAAGRQIYLDGQKLVRHFIITNTATLRLVNLILRNGNHKGANGESLGNGQPGMGGSIYSAGGTLEMIGCNFVDNHALGGNGGPPRVGGILNPSTHGAPAYGGAIYSVAGQVRATDCLFSGNVATGGTGIQGDIYSARGEDAFGGALFCSNSIALVLRGTLTNNSAVAGEMTPGRPARGRPLGGGGCAVRGGSTTLSNCIVTANWSVGATRVAQDFVETGTAYAGAIFASDGEMLIEGTILTRNSAVGGAGAARQTFAYSADANGGALVVRGGHLELRNSALTFNRAEGGIAVRLPGIGFGGAGNGYGGAIYALGEVNMVNCTLAENTAIGGGGEVGSSGGSAYGGACGIGEGGRLGLLNVTIAANTLQPRVPPPDTEARGSSLWVTGRRRQSHQCYRLLLTDSDQHLGFSHGWRLQHLL